MNIVIIGATSGVGKTLFEKYANENNRIGIIARRAGEGLFWVMPVEKVARQIISAILKKKSKAYVTRHWHILAIINKNLPFFLYKRL